MDKYEKMDIQKFAASNYASKDNLVIGLYKNVIQQTVEFMDEVGVKDVNDTFNVFSILVHNGYLSYDKKMTPSSDKTFDIFGYEGADILLGNGNCLNFANFLKQIYQEQGHESYVVANYMNIKDSNFNAFNRLMQLVLRFNHAVTYVNADDTPYMFDSLNVEAFLYNGAIIQKGNKGDKLTVNFDKTYLLNDMSFEQLRGVKRVHSMYMVKDITDQMDIQQKFGKINPETYALLNDSDCMDQFHENIAVDLERAHFMKKYYKHR